MISLVRHIMRFCGPYARRIRIAWIFSFLKSVCANAPVFVAIALVGLLMRGEASYGICVAAAVVIGVLLMLQSVFQNITDRLQSTAGYELFADKRRELADHLRRLPMGYFSAGNTGRVSSVLSNDMVFIEEHSMMILADIASDVFSQVVITVFLFFLNPLIGAAVLAVELVAIAMAQFMSSESLDDSVRRQQAIEDLSGAVLEYVEGMAINRSFNRAGEGARELRSAFAQMTESSLAFERNYAPWERRLSIVYGVGIAGAVALASWLLQAGRLEPSIFVGVTLFAFNLFKPIEHLYQQTPQITIMKNSLDRLEAVLAEGEIDDKGTARIPDAAAVSSSVPEIEFCDVHFGYGGEEVLKGVSFSAARGRTVALVGQSGSGKTTLANLLARFWDVSAGAVLVRGTDVRAVPLSDLMEQVSIVFQKVYLFEDTVYNNIALGRPDATPSEVHEAARKARCSDFIEALPYGFDTVVGEGGATLSGGERQRISIARGILKDAPIVILDEATASIDADNEAAIQEAMSEICRDKTTLVIAHRFKTIAQADTIVVLDGGVVAEVGTHAQLMAREGRYARMARLERAADSWSMSAEGGDAL